MHKILTAVFVGGLARAVLVGLGVGVVSFVGFEALLTSAMNQIHGSLDGLPNTLLSIMGIAKIDIGLNIIASAYAIRIAMIPLRRFRVL